MKKKTSVCDYDCGYFAYDHCEHHLKIKERTSCKYWKPRPKPNIAPGSAINDYYMGNR